ncbi:helix-turn-helix domain-containing protein [Pedococcus sp. KACC 23699]|uniref:Helix-turn-helix domain-containing protein n=1 Tax=Pedococcus sp. KACC 23699 TaxID=3149228 RepID=A0AAU7JR01_9MICO
MDTERQLRRSARARLLDAADELFYAHGIAATGVDAIIERAEVATASLYKNFRGKDDLVAAYLVARDERWRQHWEACIAREQDPLDRSLALFAAMDDWNDGDASRGCAHVTASLQLPADHPGRSVAHQHKEHISERLGQLVREAGVPDHHEATQDLLLIYEGMFTLLALELDPDPVGRARDLASWRLSSTREVGAGTDRPSSARP